MYGRALGFDFSYVDDDRLVLDDQHFLTDSSSLTRAFARGYFPESARDHAYYRPLVTLSYALDARASGAHATAYHRTNLLLHATAGLWILVLLWRLGYGERAAAFAALVFVAHPALTQAVAWIPGRPDALMTWFALAATLCLWRAVESGSALYRAGHLALWLCALLSKESALVLPLVYAAYGVLWLRRSPRALAKPWLLLGYGAVLGLYFAARWSALSTSPGATLALLASSFSNLSVLLTGLGKLVLPVGLSVLATPLDTPLWPGLAALLALALVGSRAWIRKERAAFALAVFALTLLPNLPASGQLVLECRLYLPALAVALLGAELFERSPLPPKYKDALAAALVATFAVLGLSYSENFRDRTAFAEAAVRGSPRLSLAHRNLGVTRHVAGDATSAESEYRAALALNPNEPVASNNLGVIAMARGELGKAEAFLRRELELNPDYAPAHQNLARLLSATGRSEEAARHAARAGAP